MLSILRADATSGQPDDGAGLLGLQVSVGTLPVAHNGRIGSPRADKSPLVPLFR